ncbi:hypothetical protein [Flexivirga sp.]|uniref:hypothetical protein n=1 Tax=Flexivirga sp. TaxID=1962927 RepID=UPI003F80661B
MTFGAVRVVDLPSRWSIGDRNELPARLMRQGSSAVCNISGLAAWWSALPIGMSKLER